MDCTGVASHLVAYHFAADSLAEEERDAIDAHLLGCRSCLEAYLRLKRAADKRPLDRPSASTRERLRAAVAAEFAKPPAHATPARARGAFLGRRIPLYQGIAAAAVAASIALALPTLLRSDRLRAAHDPDHATEIDTARPRAASLTIY